MYYELDVLRNCGKELNEALANDWVSKCRAERLLRQQMMSVAKAEWRRHGGGYGKIRIIFDDRI